MPRTSRVPRRVEMMPRVFVHIGGKSLTVEGRKEAIRRKADIKRKEYQGRKEGIRRKEGRNAKDGRKE